MQKHFQNIESHLLLTQIINQVDIRGYRDATVCITVLGEGDKMFELFNENYEYNEDIPYLANVAIENMIIDLYTSFQNRMLIDFTSKHITVTF